MKLYLTQDAIAGFLRRHRDGGVLAATAAAVATPRCTCGATAILLGMFAGRMPWAPIIAFMVASPLTSPEELVRSAGLFGWPFALSFFGASILSGLLGGGGAQALDRRGWLAGQERYRPSAVVSSHPVATLASRMSGSQFFPPSGFDRRPIAACVGGCDCSGIIQVSIPLTLAPAGGPSAQRNTAQEACG